MTARCEPELSKVLASFQRKTERLVNFYLLDQIHTLKGPLFTDRCILVLSSPRGGGVSDQTEGFASLSLGPIGFAVTDSALLASHAGRACPGIDGSRDDDDRPCFSPAACWIGTPHGHISFLCTNRVGVS